MSSRRVILSTIWSCLPTRDTLFGKKIQWSIEILGGARSLVRPKLMINLVILSGRKPRDQQSGSILNRVLMSRMVLPVLSVRCVGRHSPILSFGLVAVVHLPFGAILIIRNVVALKINSYHNLE
jgi:hypothetical protein